MKLTLGEIAKLFPHNTLTLPATTGVVDFCQDTRKLTPGALYVAVPGDHFDGHDFVKEAFAKGACAALVSRPQMGENCFVCDDTVQGLAKLAHYYRKKFHQPVIAITGSSGKTTTKELLSHVLSAFAPVVATVGNLNNHIGVPLTIAKFNEQAGFFIVEMGMNHFGEIHHLTKMVEPTVALITNIGLAHIENLGGTRDGVAKAKGELFLALNANATAILNNDDEKIRTLPTRAHKITFGIDVPSEIRATEIQFDSTGTRFTLNCGQQSHPVHLSLVGRHHILNALAVFAISRVLQLDSQKVIQQLESFSVTFNRGRVIPHGRIIFIDDTYNANPESMKMACEALVLQFSSAKKVALLGGMLELGRASPEYHRDVGAFAKKIGIDEIFAYGGDAKAYLEGFGYSAVEVAEHFFETQAAMANAAAQAQQDDSGRVAILVKGSRGMKMENVLQMMIAK